MLRSGTLATAANVLHVHLADHPMLVDKAEMFADGLSLLRPRNKNRLVLFCWCNDKLTVHNNNKRQVYQVLTSQYQAVLWVVSTELPDQCWMIRLLADCCCNQESQLAMMVIGDSLQNPDWSFLEKNVYVFCF